MNLVGKTNNRVSCIETKTYNYLTDDNENIKKQEIQKSVS